MSALGRMPAVLGLGLMLGLGFVVAALTQDAKLGIAVGLGWLVVYLVMRISTLNAGLRHLDKAAARLGLVRRGWFGHLFEGELPEIGRVRAIVMPVDPDSRRRALRVKIGTKLPPLEGPIAHALAGRAADAWSYRDGSWELSKEIDEDGGEATLALRHAELGIGFAHLVLAARKMSPALRAAMARPEALRDMAGSPLWQELRTLARADLGEAAALRLAALLRDPVLFRELAQRETESPGEAFSEMLRVVPQSAEALEVLDARIARRDDLPVDGLRRIALGLRTLGHPRRDEVLGALLDHPDEGLRLTALHSLHEVGTPATVPALARLAAAGKGDLALLAGDAIGAIKRRARGAPSGGLALVESGEVGALALAPESGEETPW